MIPEVALEECVVCSHPEHLMVDAVLAKTGNLGIVARAFRFDLVLLTAHARSHANKPLTLLADLAFELNVQPYRLAAAQHGESNWAWLWSEAMRREGDEKRRRDYDQGVAERRATREAATTAANEARLAARLAANRARVAKKELRKDDARRKASQAAQRLEAQRMAHIARLERCVAHEEANLAAASAAKARREARQATPAYQRAIRPNQKLPPGAECVYCGDPATTWDHLVTPARGGGDGPDNRVPACRPCNCSGKLGRTPAEWFELLGLPVSEEFFALFPTIERRQTAGVPPDRRGRWRTGIAN